MNYPKIDWTKEPSIVVLTGAEEYFKDALVSQARRVLSGYTYNLLWAGIDSDAVLRNHLYETSFFQSNKLLVIRDANKAGQKLLEGYTDQPCSDNVVVLVAKKGRLPKWFKALKCNQKAACDSLKPWEYKEWLVKYAQKHGYSLDDSYADAIHQNVGDDLYALSNETRKMFLYCGESKTITAPDIQAVLFQHTTISPFMITEAWGLRKTESALRMASIYFWQAADRYAVLPIISIFLGHISKLIQFRSLYQEQAFNQSSICQLMGISSYVYDKISQQAQGWKLRELRECYTQMCEIESRTKCGANGQQLLYLFLSESDL